MPSLCAGAITHVISRFGTVPIRASGSCFAAKSPPAGARNDIVAIVFGSAASRYDPDWWALRSYSTLKRRAAAPREGFRTNGTPSPSERKEGYAAPDHSLCGCVLQALTRCRKQSIPRGDSHLKLAVLSLTGKWAMTGAKRDGGREASHAVVRTDSPRPADCKPLHTVMAVA